MTLTDLLDSIGVHKAPENHEHRRPQWEQVDCPWCSKDWHHYRLGIHKKYLYANCWACGPKKISEYIHEVSNKPWGEIKNLLNGLDRYTTLRDEKPLGKLVLPDNLGTLKDVHREYLQERRFDPDELIKLWNIQGIGLSAKLSWRIYIPILYKGKTASWTTRSLSDEGLRYISAGSDQEAIPKKKLLFGEDYVRHAAIIVEGPFDVFRIGPGAVATLGTAYSKAQMVKITKYPVRVICFDSEPAAQARARQLCASLEGFSGKTYNIQIDAKDPGSAGEKDIRFLRKKFLE